MMMRTQAEKLVERLKNACVFHRFDEPGVYAEYVRALAQYDYDRMNAAIDAAIEEDSRNVPAISLLIKKYKGTSNTPKGQVEIKNDEYCAICDDRGFVLIKEKHPETGTTYEYILYCPYCNVGRTYAYDGSQCKGHKSQYKIPPLTKCFGDEGIQAMRETNLKKRAKRIETISPIKKELQTVGKSIPDSWQYDVPF